MMKRTEWKLDPDLWTNINSLSEGSDENKILPRGVNEMSDEALDYMFIISELEKLENHCKGTEESKMIENAKIKIIRRYTSKTKKDLKQRYK